MGVAVKKKIKFFFKIDMYISQVMFWLLRRFEILQIYSVIGRHPAILPREISSHFIWG